MTPWKLSPAMLFVAACASAPAPTSAPVPEPAAAVAARPATPPPAPAPARLDPTGAYEFTTVTPDGQTVSGTLYITGKEGAYAGRIVTNIFPEMAVTGATVKDNAIDVQAAMPEGELLLHMVMNGANFTGHWTLGPDSGDFNGKKLPKQ